MKITIAATSAPVSGRASARPSKDRWARSGATGGAVGGEGCVATEEDMVGLPEGVRRGGRAGPAPPPRGYRGLFSGCWVIGGVLGLLTMDGPVGTAPPPPLALSVMGGGQ